MMDEDDEELAVFSRTLLDKFGQVRHELISNEYHKGSGCWAEELNYGLLAYISRIFVNPEYHRQGVGSWVLKQLLGSKHFNEGDVLLCWPASESQGTGDGPEEIDRHKKGLNNGIVTFFRKNGFRRIGRTQFFGFVLDPTHPSHSTAMADDPNIPDRPASHTGGILALLDPQGITDPEQHRQDFPIHTSIFKDMDESIIPVIRSSYANNPDSVRIHDEHGFSPLAVAAARGNYLALKTLLELGVQEEDLINRDNSESLTPLEICEKQLRSAREFSETFLGKWEGHDEGMLKCRAALMRAMGMHIEGTDEEFALHAKLGCTCGVCAGGWLSARMRFRLKVTAVVSSDMTHDELTRYKGRMNPKVFEGVYSLSFIPLAHRIRFYKRDCYQFADTFNLITKKLTESNGIPTFLTSAHTDPTHRYAMDAVIHMAQENSPMGDDTWEESHGDSPELDDMPTCANDLEFELVREKMGLSDMRGPYHALEMEDGFFSSDDSDW